LSEDDRPSVVRLAVELMSSALSIDSFTPRGMMRMSFGMMRLTAEAMKLITPWEGNRVAWQEFQNKLQTFDLFEYADSTLGLNAGARPTLEELVARASALDTYSAVWATEGAGHYHAESSRGRTTHGLLREESVGNIARKSLTPLHSGMGLSLANRVLLGLDTRGGASAVRDCLQEFLALCRENSCDGFAGVAYEALGLVVRNLHPQLVPAVDRELSAADEELLGYFWHGVGRAIYFAPTNFLTSGNLSGRAVEMTRREPPHETGRLNALSGLAWALFMVNVRHEEVLAELLRGQGRSLSSDGDAFANGVGAATVVWRDAAPDDTRLAALCQYRPDGNDAALAEQWDRLVRQPCSDSLQRFYPTIRDCRRIGEVFRYRSLPELVTRLEAERDAGLEGAGERRAR
jgi:hypothetical protein